MNVDGDERTGRSESSAAELVSAWNAIHEHLSSISCLSDRSMLCDEGHTIGSHPGDGDSASTGRGRDLLESEVHVTIDESRCTGSGRGEEGRLSQVVGRSNTSLARHIHETVLDVCLGAIVRSQCPIRLTDIGRVVGDLAVINVHLTSGIVVDPSTTERTSAE